MNFFIEFACKLLEQTKVNAPTFIYKILYGADPENFISGRSASHAQYLWKDGIYIDKHIPKQYVDELDAIEGIELRASCEGEDEHHPTFVIFRPINQNESFVKKLINKLNKFPDIKAGYDRGMEGKLRLGVTTNLWHSKNPKLFDKWWKELPRKIKKCL